MGSVFYSNVIKINIFDEMKILNQKNNFLGIQKKHSSFEDSKIVILPVPYEKTVSYGKGTKNGPKKIIEASHFVEFYDEELRRELCFQEGIVTLPLLAVEEKSANRALTVIYNRVKEMLAKEKFVVTLGGEHTVSQAPIKAHFEKFNNLSVLQIDAHSDLRQTYEGTKYSHACVMARVAEFTTDIHQVGIRAQDVSEAKFIVEKNINTYYMRQIRSGKYGKNWQKKVAEKLNDNVYITFDVDGFDPSVIASTGTPEPGGLFWDETMDLLNIVGQTKNIVGFDVVELSPKRNQPESDFNTAKLVYKILNYAFQVE